MTKPSARPSTSLVADPKTVAFGSDGSSAIDKLLTIRNQGSTPVTIEDCYVIDSPAFDATVIGDPTIPGGGAGKIEVQHFPDIHASETGWAIVSTTDGMLEVPLTGRPSSVNTSSMAGGLEVFPQVIDLGQVAVGDTQYARALVRNRGSRKIDFGKTQLATGGGDAFSGYQGSPLEGGDERDAPLCMFHPTKPGTFSAMLNLTDISGAQIFGAVHVTGTAVAKKAGDPAPIPKSNWVAKTLTEAHQMDAARQQTMTAVQQWSHATNASVGSTYAELRSEWTTYLGATSGNPRISRIAMPVEGAMKELLSNFIVDGVNNNGLQTEKHVAHAIDGHHPEAGGAVEGATEGGAKEGAKEGVETGAHGAGHAGKGVAHEVEHGAEHAGKGAAHGAEHAGEHAAEGEIAAEVGESLAALGIGFVAGVLLETVGHLLYNWIVGDHELEEVAREAHDEGYTQGSHAASMAIKAKVGELDAAESAMRAAQIAKIDNAVSLSFAARSVAELHAINARIAAMAASAAKLKATPGLSDRLLHLWVRDHAGTATTNASDVFKGQWNEATAELAEKDKKHFAKGKLIDQPDLFVSQLAYEWQRRGLPVKPEFQAQLLAEIGMKPGQELEGASAAAAANTAVARFSDREVVFAGFIDGGELDKQLPKGEDNNPRADIHTSDHVSCFPTLAVGNGSCYVTGFRYEIEGGGRMVHAYTTPGSDKFESLSYVKKTAQLTHHLAPSASGDIAYAIIRQFEEEGIHVEQEADAARNASLKAEEGEDIANPLVRHTDGRPEPVTVFSIAIAPDAQLSDNLKAALASGWIDSGGSKKNRRYGNVVLRFRSA